MRNPIKAFGKTAEAAKEAKRQIIVTVITFAACFVCMGIGSFASDIFTTSAADTVKEMNRIQNEMDQFQKTDPAFTGVTDIKTAYNIKIEWTGVKLDTGRWSTDKAMFWDWIRPAFNYNSATEYNQTRETFISTKGLGKCLFTTQFMAPYDIEEAARKKYANSLGPDGKPTAVNMDIVDNAYKCAASENDYYAWPIGEESDGSYRYVARVMYGAPNSSSIKQRVCMFMFTVQHTAGADGVDNMTIKDFECWP